MFKALTVFCLSGIHSLSAAHAASPLAFTAVAVALFLALFGVAEMLRRQPWPNRELLYDLTNSFICSLLGLLLGITLYTSGEPIYAVSLLVMLATVGIRRYWLPSLHFVGFTLLVLGFLNALNGSVLGTFFDEYSPVGIMIAVGPLVVAALALLVPPRFWRAVSFRLFGVPAPRGAV